MCLGHIIHATAGENWEQLAKKIQNKDVMNKCYLYKKYIKFQMKDGEMSYIIFVHLNCC